MTPKKIDKEKYLRILDRLSKKETQASIVTAEKCSYGTISAAKQWDEQGRPNAISGTSTRGTSEVGNISKIELSIPSFWLELIDDNIEAGIWNDRSDAIVDLIRTYFRPHMDENKPDLRKITPEQVKAARSRASTRKSILGELKKEAIPMLEKDEFLEKPSEEEMKARQAEWEIRRKELEAIESAVRGKQVNLREILIEELENIIPLKKMSESEQNARDEDKKKRYEELELELKEIKKRLKNLEEKDNE